MTEELDVMLLGNQQGESAESLLIYWSLKKAICNPTCCYQWCCVLVSVMS